MTTGVPVHQVDAFAEEAFTGNPAGVCLLDRAARPAWMQSVAAETNLPMTAFVEPREATGCASPAAPSPCSKAAC